VDYTPADIRTFLTDTFSDEEIEIFCFDNFPWVQNEFSSGMSKNEKTRRLIEYCQRHELVPQLISALHIARRDPFERRFGKISPQDQLRLVPPIPEPGAAPEGPLPGSQVLVDQLIENQHQAIRYYQIFAFGLIALGLVAIVVAWLAVPNTFKLLTGIGGGFVCSLSTIQFREILRRREKVGVFEAIQDRLDAIEKGPETTDMDTRRRIDNLLWQVVERTAVG
jgi:hypothetical protein